MDFMDDMRAIGAIVTSAAAVGTGSIPVVTITSSAQGILGVLGVTTTTTIALPVAGVVAVVGVGLLVHQKIQAGQGK